MKILKGEFKSYFTPTERKVNQKIIDGKTNKQIAEELAISVNTVRTHIQNMFNKTKIRNRRGIARKYKIELTEALEENIIEIKNNLRELFLLIDYYSEIIEEQEKELSLIKCQI